MQCHNNDSLFAHCSLFLSSSRNADNGSSDRSNRSSLSVGSCSSGSAGGNGAKRNSSSLYINNPNSLEVEAGCGSPEGMGSSTTANLHPQHGHFHFANFEYGPGPGGGGGAKLVIGNTRVLATALTTQADIPRSVSVPLSRSNSRKDSGSVSYHFGWYIQGKPPFASHCMLVSLYFPDSIASLYLPIASRVYLKKVKGALVWAKQSRRQVAAVSGIEIIGHSSASTYSCTRTTSKVDTFSGGALAKKLAVLNRSDGTASRSLAHWSSRAVVVTAESIVQTNVGQ